MKYAIVFIAQIQFFNGFRMKNLPT